MLPSSWYLVKVYVINVLLSLKGFIVFLMSAFDLAFSWSGTTNSWSALYANIVVRHKCLYSNLFPLFTIKSLPNLKVNERTSQELCIIKVTAGELSTVPEQLDHHF